jgi:plasmid stabilization system protein ParE
MSVPVEFSDVAQVDVDEIVDWYDREAPGVSTRFLKRLADTIDRISRFPALAIEGPRNTRIARVRRFKYFVLYRVDHDCATILAVFHGRRDPKSWQRRA